MADSQTARTRLAASARGRLAERLRSLRVQGWPGRSVTQRQIAQALGASAPLVSSWESPVSGALPPLERLDAYARFFATERSIQSEPARLLEVADLDEDEEMTRKSLLVELTALRSEALGAQTRGPRPPSFWRFGDDAPVRVISTVLPATEVSSPYASPWHPNYLPTLLSADMDSVLAVYGQIRAENPSSKVTWVPSDQVTGDDFNSHVVILGGSEGVAGLTAGADPLGYYRRRLNLPVFARRRRDVDPDMPGSLGALEREFVVTVDDQGRPDFTGRREQVHRPRFMTDHDDDELRRGPGGEPILEYDVGLLARQPNEMNLEATVTVCSGIFSRGTFGVVRSVTDPQMREQNLAQLAEILDLSRFWILMYIPIFGGREGLTTLTPDLTRPMSIRATSERARGAGDR